MNVSFALKKAKIIFKDNRTLLLILFCWFFGGFLVYSLILRHNFLEALKESLFFRKNEGLFSNAYEMWSQGIVFGVIVSFITANIMEKYNPERGCRMMAKELSDHIIIIGYTHLGQRLVNYLKEKKVPFCLIEKNKEAVDDLLREGQPVIVDDARQPDALSDANIGKAKMLIIASNNLETALIATKRARERNKDLRIVARCFQDEFCEIIESLGANEVISSSKNAFDDITKNLCI